MTVNVVMPWDAQAITRGDLDQAWSAALAAGLYPVAVKGKKPVEGNGWNAAGLTPLPKMPEGADGFGLQLDKSGLVGIDVDVPEPELSGRILASLRTQLGEDVAVRFGNGSKFTVYVSCPDRCRDDKYDVHVGNTGHKVQVLSGSNQSVVRGTHPDTGKAYRWEGGLSFPRVDDPGALALGAIRAAGHEPRRAEKAGASDTSAVLSLKPTDPAMQAYAKSLANATLESLRKHGRDGTINGTLVKAMASSIAPAVIWGLLDEDAVVEAACAHGRDPDDCGSGGRSYRDEVQRGIETPKAGSELLNLVEPRGFDAIDPSAFQTSAQPQPIQVAPVGAYKLHNPLERAMGSSGRWLVKGLLRRGWIASIFAKPKAGKTTLTVDLAFHVARGMRWCGRDVKRAVPVLFITERVDQISRSFAALAAKYEVGAAELLVSVQGIADCNVTDPHWRTRMDATMEAFRALHGQYPGLIVFDTLAKLSAGAEENSAKDMGIINASLRNLQAAYADPVMITIGHSGKDETKGERGSNSTMGDRDVGISVVSHEDDENTRTARIEYANELEPNKSIVTFRINVVKLGDVVVDDDGETEEVMGALIEPVNVERPREEREIGKYTESQMQNVWRLANHYGTEGEFEFNDGDTPLLTKRIIVHERFDMALQEGLAGEPVTGTARRDVVRALEKFLGKPRDSLFGVSPELPDSRHNKLTRYFKSETVARIVPTEGPQNA